MLAVSNQFRIPSGILAADGWHESRFDRHARGKRGEVGIWQVKRRGAVQGAFLRLTDAQLEDVPTNAWLAASYMAAMVKQCRRHYLSRYNGGRCGPTKYSTGILADLRLGERLEARLERR